MPGVLAANFLLPANSLFNPLGSSVVVVVVLDATASVSGSSAASVTAGSGGASLDGASVVLLPGRFLAIKGFTLLTWTVALAAAFGLEAMLALFLFLRRARGLLSTGAGVSS